MNENDNKLLIYRDICGHIKNCDTISFRFLTYLFNPQWYAHVKERIYNLISEASAELAYAKWSSEENKKEFKKKLHQLETVFFKL